MFLGLIGSVTVQAIFQNIADRLNTIAGADNIIVIKDGRIEQEGKHAELISVEGTYRNFVNARTNMIGWAQTE